MRVRQVLGDNFCFFYQVINEAFTRAVARYHQVIGTNGLGIDLVRTAAVKHLLRDQTYEFAPNSRIRVLPGAYEIEIRQNGVWLPLARLRTGRDVRAFVTANMRRVPSRQSCAGARAIDAPVDWDLLDTL